MNTPHCLLKKWRKESKRAMLAHDGSSAIWHRVHIWLGIPVALISAGVAGVAALENDIVQLKLIAGFGGVAAAMLAGLQTFLNAEKSSENHTKAASGYRAVIREIDQITLLDNIDEERIVPIRESIDELDVNSPRWLRRAWLRAERKLGKASSAT